MGGRRRLAWVQYLGSVRNGCSGGEGLAPGCFNHMHAFSGIPVHESQNDGPVRGTRYVVKPAL